MALVTIESPVQISSASKFSDINGKSILESPEEMQEQVNICTDGVLLVDKNNHVKTTEKRFPSPLTVAAPVKRSQRIKLSKGMIEPQTEINEDGSLIIPEVCSEVIVNSVYPGTECQEQLVKSKVQLVERKPLMAASSSQVEKKNDNELEKSEKMATDAFRFLRQTSSGRIVKRTELASVDLKEFWVDAPTKSKSSTSPPKLTNESEVQQKVMVNKSNAVVVSTEKHKVQNRVINLRQLEAPELCSELTKITQLTNNNSSTPKKDSEKCGSESVEVEQGKKKFRLTDYGFRSSKDPYSSTLCSENVSVKKEVVEEMKNSEKSETSVCEETAVSENDDIENTCLLRVKLDHDYDEKNPSRLPISSENENENNDAHEMEVREIKTEISDDVVSSDKESAATEMTVNEELEIKDEKSTPKRRESKDEGGRSRKKVRLINEVRTLIDESIKATKAMSIPTATRTGTRKTRVLRHKKKRTECEMLLDMLSETRGPDKLIRVKGRKLPPSPIIPLKNVAKVTRVKADVNELVPVVKTCDSPNKSQLSLSASKKNVTSLVAQRKKAIRMKLNLEKKKKEKLIKNSNASTENSSENSSTKMIVLQDLKEKVKIKMEQSTGQNSRQDVSFTPITLPFNYNSTNGDLNLKRPPGRPRIHHFPQTHKPAKVSRHGKILGRPRKCSVKTKERTLLPSGTIQSVSGIPNSTTVTINNTQSLVGQSFVLRVPVISLSPTTLSNNFSISTNTIDSKPELTIKKNPGIEHRDYSRQRSSQRQAESSYRYKEIAVKSHADFAEIILITNTKPKNGLNPQIFKELKTALLTARKDIKCKVVLLHGTGSVFCSGVDLNYLVKDNKDQRQKAVTEMVASMRDFLRMLISYPKPIIVAVNGCATGLGVGLLLLCDIVYASDKATFSMPYSKLGQVPEGCASYTLPKNISMSMVNELIIGGRRLTATEASECGLVSKVFWPNDLLEDVIPRVQKMAAQSAHAMETTKALLRQRMKADLEATLENECQLLFSQWCQLECQQAMKEFVDQSEFV